MSEDYLGKYTIKEVVVLDKVILDVYDDVKNRMPFCSTGSPELDYCYDCSDSDYYKDNFHENYQFGTCSPCGHNCFSCVDILTCLTCQEGYNLSEDGKCLTNPSGWFYFTMVCLFLLLIYCWIKIVRDIKKRYGAWKKVRKRKMKKSIVENRIIDYNKNFPILLYASNNECVICLELLNEGENFRNFDCKRHLAHLNCYKDWRGSDKDHNCPMCM